MGWRLSNLELTLFKKTHEFFFLDDLVYFGCCDEWETTGDESVFVHSFEEAQDVYICDKQWLN